MICFHVDNESEITLISKNYIITGDKFVSLDDYRDSEDSNCDSASYKQIKHINITLI